MNPTVVVNKKDTPFDVYIGRPSKWGNPFVVGQDGTREEVIAKHRAWLQTQPQLLASIHELRGKRIACWCAPLSCHGDTLAELANAATPRFDNQPAPITREQRRSFEELYGPDAQMICDFHGNIDGMPAVNPR